MRKACRRIHADAAGAIAHVAVVRVAAFGNSGARVGQVGPATAGCGCCACGGAGSGGAGSST